MQIDSILLNIAVAHGLEAKPLLALFELKPVAEANNIYASDSGLRLIVTGMGRTNMEYSLAKLAASDRVDPSLSAWLNIGIAGHQRLAVGETLLANKITAAEDGKSVYPSPMLSGLQTGALITVDEPETNYPEDAAYDMEAFSFWKAAASMSPLDLVQSYKLISDNPDSGTECVTPALISELFHSARQEIGQLVRQLQDLAAAHKAAITDAPEFQHFKATVHLSATQEIQVRRLCQRFHALKIESELQAVASQRFQDSRALISALRTALTEADWNKKRDGAGANISKVDKGNEGDTGGMIP